MPSCRTYARHLAVIDSRLSSKIPALLSVDAVEPLADQSSVICLRTKDRLSRFAAEPPPDWVCKTLCRAMAAGLMIICSLLLVNINQNRVKRKPSHRLLLEPRPSRPLPVLAEWSEKPMRTEVNKRFKAPKCRCFLWNCTPGT
jgi:hypothetical protein